MSTVTVELSGSALTGVGGLAGSAAQAALMLPQTVKLGRVRPKSRTTALKLSSYFDPARAAAPDATHWADKAQAAIARMYLNDIKGCCVIAGKYHLLGVASGNKAGTPLVVSDNEIDQMYQLLKVGPGDSGCDIGQVLGYWRDRGLPVNGTPHRIDGFVSVDWTNQALVKAMVAALGGGTIGISLPQAWTQNAVWDVTNSPVVGGHDVTVVDYDAAGVYVSSWGRLYRITWRAFLSRRWLDEAYAVLLPEWYGADGLAPSGIAVADLKADLDKLSHGDAPDVGPSPPPVPPTPPAPPVPQPSGPNYVGAVRMTGHVPAFGGDATFTGTIKLSPADVAHLAGFAWPSFDTVTHLVEAAITVIRQDGPLMVQTVTTLLKLAADIRGADIAAVMADLNAVAVDVPKLVADIRAAFAD